MRRSGNKPGRKSDYPTLAAFVAEFGSDIDETEQMCHLAWRALEQIAA